MSHTSVGRPRSGRTGVKLTLYVAEGSRSDAAAIAKARGIRSISDLFEKLIEAEKHRKRGIASVIAAAAK